MRKRWLMVLAIVLAITSILSACTPSLEDGRVTSESLAKLRKQYPYRDGNTATGQIESYDQMFPTFEDLAKSLVGNVQAVVILELTGDWYAATNTEIRPSSDEELNLALPGGNCGLTWVLHDAVVEKVLWGGEDINANDKITLGFGSLLATSGQDVESSYVKKQKYVCILEDRSEMNLGTDTLFGVGKLYTYYLTRQDIVLSLSSAKCQDDNSGLTLTAFESLVNETLGPPDAELTPVEPELETE